MPRDLSDVIHYFVPELASDTEKESRSDREAQTKPRFGTEAAPVLPVLALPIADADVLRAAFAWNLVVEVARMGGQSVLVAPPQDSHSPLWPEAGKGPLGTEVLFAESGDLASLHRTAVDAAVERAARAEEGGVVFVRVPPVWLRNAADAGNLLRWVLLFTSSEKQEMLETYGLAKLLQSARIDSEIGVTFHGMKELATADDAFRKLAEVASRRLGIALSSYGALLDDLEVYRAIVAHRPIGLSHPQSPAAQTLRDVATMLLSRARHYQLA